VSSIARISRRNVPYNPLLTGRAREPLEEINMSGNRYKAAGMANEAAGKIKQGVGKAVGSDK
jgi:hypothetical protein